MGRYERQLPLASSKCVCKHARVSVYSPLRVTIARSCFWIVHSMLSCCCFQKEANVPADRVQVRRTGPEERAHQIQMKAGQITYAHESKLPLCVLSLLTIHQLFTQTSYECLEATR